MRYELAFLALPVAALAACSSQPSGTPEGLGSATVEIRLAPPSVKCAVIQVVGTSTVTYRFTVVPSGNTVFALDGLPLGQDTFTASALSVPCTQGDSPPTWVSDPITATVSADPINLTFAMTEVADGGRANVGLDFPSSIHGVLAEFAIPTADSGPYPIVAGPDGNLWFTEESAGKVGRITPSGVIVEFALPATLGIGDITVGPDGNLWVIESNHNVARVTPTGTFTEFPLPSSVTLFHEITTGPDGNLWFTEQSGIGRMSVTGFVTEFPLPGTSPATIATGPDGNLWFTDTAHSTFARITPAGVVTQFTLPTPDSGPMGIVTGADGNLWLTEGNANRIARVVPATGVATEFLVPTANAGLFYGLAAGSDGNIWFTEAGKIGRISQAGAFAEFSVPSAFIGEITAGPDGSMWFVEATANRIGRFAP